MSTQRRLYFLDYLRVALTMLVIAHHVAQTYGPTGGDWPVKGEPVSEAAREIRRLGGTLYFTAKPGHVALLAALGMATAGVQETPSLWLSLLAGLGVVVWMIAQVARLPREAAS